MFPCSLKPLRGLQKRKTTEASCYLYFPLGTWIFLNFAHQDKLTKNRSLILATVRLSSKDNEYHRFRNLIVQLSNR